jgi:hypothetical protein
MVRSIARPAAGAVVAAVAFALHSPSLAFGWTELDDRDLVVDDQAFLKASGSVLHAFTRSYFHVVDAAHAYYRPIVTASFVLDASWSGVHPFGYHLTNVALHAIASALLFALLRAVELEPPVAATAAIAFAVHPALVPAVAWVPGRNDVLLAIFALSAWLLLLRAVERRSVRALAAHLACFAGALGTKETAVVLPLVFATDLTFRSRAPGGDLVARRTVLGLVLAWSALLGVRLAVQHALHLAPLASVAALDLRRAPPLLIAGFGQLLLPIDPSLVGVADDAPVARGVVALAGLAAAAWAARGLRPAVVGVGIASSVLLALPAALAGGTVVLGHRLYLPACGLAIAVAEVGRGLSRERNASIAFLVAAIGAMAVMAAGFEATFRDRRRFARAAVEGAPRSSLAHFCLGQSYQIDGEADRALAEYGAALRLGSIDVVHNNIAVILMARGRWVDAERELDEEIAVNPGYARAYTNLSVVLRHEGRQDASNEAAAKARALGEPLEGGE